MLGRGEAARVVVKSSQQWYDAAGGGEDAALADFLLAALDADDGVSHAAEQLAGMLANAHREGNVEIEVLALDRLARLHAEQGEMGDALALLACADAAMPAVYHVVSDTDRIDHDQARSLLTAARPGRLT
jgi:predicted negative regulator of RcsB-dependent stress response